MLIIIDFDRGIDTADNRDDIDLAISSGDLELQILLGLKVRRHAENIEGFRAVEVKSLAAPAFGKLQGEDAHADEVGTVNALETLGDDAFDTEQSGSLGGPIPG